MHKLLYSFRDGWEALGIGRTKFLELVNAGEIETVRIGRRRLVSAEALEAYAAKLTDERVAS